MKRKLLICILICCLTLLLSIGVTFAYFNISSAQTANMTFTTIGVDAVEVDSFYKLKVLTEYGNNGIKSEIAERKNLVFKNDITLTQNLVVSRDVNIDLGGHILDLKGFKLTFKHNFEGNLTVTNGTIKSASNNVIDCITPRSVVVFDTTLVLTTINIVKFDSVKLTESLDSYLTKKMQPSYCDDIPLIKEYSGFDLSFKWSSNKPTIVSDNGQIKPISNMEEVIMSVTVTGDISLQKSFTVKIYKSSVEMCQFALEKIDEYLSKYQLLASQYYIYGNVSIPKNDIYTNATFTYTTASGNVDNTATNVVDSVLQKGGVSRSYVLTVKASIGAFNATKVYNINVVVADNYEIANEILNSISGGLILVADKTSLINLPTPAELKAKGISNADVFRIGKYVNGVFTEDNTRYIVSNNQISVVSTPSTTDEYFLELKLDFVANNPSQLVLYSKIYYTESTSGGGSEGVDPLSYWYNTLHEEILSNKTNNGYTYTSFDLPNEWYGKYVSYGVSENNYTNPTTNSLFGGALILERKTLVTTFNIDFSKLAPKDLHFVIFYKFAENADNWYSKKTNITIDGVISNNANGVPDSNLYSVLVATFDKNNDKVITLAESKNFAITDLTVNMTITTLKGIQFFNGIQNINFDNSSLKSTELAHLAALDLVNLSIKNNSLTTADLAFLPTFPNLIELDLGNTLATTKNSFTDLSSLPIYLKLTTLRANDCSLTSLNGIYKLFALQVLYANNNLIRSFRELLDLKTITTVYALDNLSGADFGSNGKYSVTVWTLLYNKFITPVKIYNTKNASGSPQLFSPTSQQIKGTGVLESIMFQDSLFTTDTLILPKNVYINSSSSYEIVWDISNLAGSKIVLNGDKYQITNLKEGANIELYSKVTVNGIDIFRCCVIKQIKVAGV